jgi:glutathione synthase/RimK-type ligase-like ATP-grasp enzyme
MSVQPLYQLAFATSAELPDIHADDAQLAATLRHLDVQPTACVWSDPAVDWERFDAVLIRTTWDYFKRYPEFLRWLASLPSPAINNAALLRWNSDKRYLLQIERLGVEIIPTRVVPGSELAAALSAMPGQQVVVKPAVSGGSWHTLRGSVGDLMFEEALAMLPAEFDYLLQPFVPEVVTDGEWSLLYFDGVFSHAVLKRAAPGDYRVQALFGGSEEALPPSAAMLASAERALQAVAALGHPDHAYVRVDGVMVDGRFLLMELEMIEPYVFMAHCPDAARRLAANLRRRLDGLNA